MKLFRRDTRILCYFDLDHCFVFDTVTNTATSNINPQAILAGKEGRLWLPVFDDEPIPDGLIEMLIHKFPSR